MSSTSSTIEQTPGFPIQRFKSFSNDNLPLSMGINDPSPDTLPAHCQIYTLYKANLMFLLCVLYQDQVQDVLDAMFERTVDSGDYVIRQGDDGDNFYVIDR